ncbi:hypothetical protein SRHO_G00057860 [Serrasalmus rhombeus]
MLKNAFGKITTLLICTQVGGAVLGGAGALPSSLQLPRGTGCVRPRRAACPGRLRVLHRLREAARRALFPARAVR